MFTRFRVGSNRPVERLTLHVSLVSPLPPSYREAFNDVNWQNPMRDKYNALINNSTWTLIPRPPEVNVVRLITTAGRINAIRDEIKRHTREEIKEVIVNGDASAIASASASNKGPIPHKTDEQKLERKNELKAKSTLLLAIPDEHL
ncbi:ribonuclease H-like domain-containing protein, partial [Tanacetum coccineum]